MTPCGRGSDVQSCVHICSSQLSCAVVCSHFKDGKSTVLYTATILWRSIRTCFDATRGFEPAILGLLVQSFTYSEAVHVMIVYVTSLVSHEGGLWPNSAS